MVTSEAAEHFHKAGFTVLSYDPRSTGESDGTPRNEIHPSHNVEDYHDALSFLKCLPIVDPARIAIWGYSLSGTVALCAAALDKRFRAVVAVAPTTVWELSKRQQVLAKAMMDRESRLVGNRPTYLPMVTESGEQPAGFGTGLGVEGVYQVVRRAVDVLPSFMPSTTLSSYYHISAFQPFGLIPFVSPTPVMLVYGENDLMSPPELQRSLIFDVLREPKQLLAVPDMGHMDVLSGPNAFSVLDAQVSFLRKFLE